MKQTKKREKRAPGSTLSGASAPQSLVQQPVVEVKPKKQAPVEEEEDRDDYEGFGSITELVKNKDILVKKEMNTIEVQQELVEK